MGRTVPFQRSRAKISHFNSYRCIQSYYTDLTRPRNKSLDDVKATDDHSTYQNINSEKKQDLSFLFCCFICFVCLFLETRSHHEELAGLELTLKPRLALNSKNLFVSVCEVLGI